MWNKSNRKKFFSENVVPLLNPFSFLIYASPCSSSSHLEVGKSSLFSSSIFLHQRLKLQEGRKVEKKGEKYRTSKDPRKKRNFPGSVTEISILRKLRLERAEFQMGRIKFYLSLSLQTVLELQHVPKKPWGLASLYLHSTLRQLATKINGKLSRWHLGGGESMLSATEIRSRRAIVGEKEQFSFQLVLI